MGTCDESWFYHYNPKLKSQSIECKHKDSSRLQKVKMEKTDDKVVHIIIL